MFVSFILAWLELVDLIGEQERLLRRNVIWLVYFMRGEGYQRVNFWGIYTNLTGDCGLAENGKFRVQSVSRTRELMGSETGLTLLLWGSIKAVEPVSGATWVGKLVSGSSYYKSLPTSDFSSVK
jgi:hypothetical protein